MLLGRSDDRRLELLREQRDVAGRNESSLFSLDHGTCGIDVVQAHIELAAQRIDRREISPRRATVATDDQRHRGNANEWAAGTHGYSLRDGAGDAKTRKAPGPRTAHHAIDVSHRDTCTRQRVGDRRHQALLGRSFHRCRRFGKHR